ncbi:HU family DNA-binding protein [Francisella philomiragia]|uniref:HU family DNA-binding protein n=1 Tax=Francisella philomiragia TaxID=28110 RepID=UPI0019060D8C|nr:HU family DNA-binding protein [Francisella philomiragia]MBK2257557.1 HU family DNA-binding protein [Francisella philomiragia]MBK2270281.1 HU family DNA-binding protein [Francisella philomiragia]MBK2272127.1 HU family DNA-binding protein [Francisella philomiragia]MBK2275966.1 HU family DNA-binding protein [Francisella philomiragia]MBK2295467.1 HU family DNA-binding protein [Francisella philomiragia]
MNKNELIHAISKEAKVTLSEAEKCLNAFTNVVTQSLKKKQNVTLVGFGTFEAKDRAARDGRNPKTGETIKISATTVPSFKAGKTLKESVQKTK